MKFYICLIVFVFIFSGCASTYSSSKQRANPFENLTEIINEPKQVVFEDLKIAISKTDLIIRKENFEDGIITASPNRFKALGKRMATTVPTIALVSPGATPFTAASYIGIHCWVTELGFNETKVEIVQVYDNPLNKGKDYRPEIMNLLLASKN